MKKRMISLGMCAAVLVTGSALVGCSSSGNVSSTSSVRPLTVTLNMKTGDQTTPEGIAAVQDAINQITENDLNIHVVLRAYTEDEYDSAIDTMLAAREADTLAGIKKSSLGNSSDTTVVEIVNGLTRTVTAFPDAYDNQIDIFMIYDYSSLLEYAEAGYLSEISGSLADDTASKINKYTSSTLLSYGEVDGSQYAVPSNTVYGDYEYLIVNKELFDSYPYTISDVTDITSLTGFLTDVATDHPEITPLYNVTDMGLISVTGQNSVVAAYVPNGANESDGYAPANIITGTVFKSYLASILTFASVNDKYPVYTTDVDMDANFAAAFVYGDAALADLYEDDYYVIKTRNPVADADEIYGAMYAVSAYTSDSDRCMELISYLYTNSELFNILLYGVENVTYTVDEDTGIVSRKYSSDNNTLYINDLYSVGNVFLAYQNDEMTEEELRLSADGWKLAKQASTDVTYSPYARFVVDWDPESTTSSSSDEGSDTMALSEYADRLSMLYDEMWAKLSEFNISIDASTGEPATVDGYLSTLETWIGLKTEVRDMVNTASSASVLGFRRQYLTWYQDLYAN
jgi:ABC-type glycerol-3-phosphate transport system substrate-binding protein